MREENEVSIPLGLDPSGALVDIEEAEKIQDYYRCPVCLEFLAVRKGPIRVHYFAHCPRGPGTPDCKLRSEIGLKEWMRENSIAPEERLAKAHKMRLILQKEAHSEYYDIYGIIPTFNKEDFKDNDEFQRTISTLLISGDSIDGKVYPEAFHPNESEARIRLKPDESNFRVCISSGIRKEPVVGVWTADGVQPHDVFIGDEQRAERIKSSIPLREGETIYYVLGKYETEPDFQFKRIQIGNKIIVSFEIRREIEDKIRGFLPKAILEKSSFTVDLLQPIELNPQIIGPVDGSPNSDILVSIIPPPGRNLNLEIVSVPSSSSPVIPLPSTAPGEPRYYLTKFPNEGSKKMSVHYMDRHVFLQFHSSSVSQARPMKKPIVETDIYAVILCNGVRRKIFPWNNDRIELEKPEELSVGQVVELLGPGKLSVNLESRREEGQAKQESTRLELLTDIIKSDYGAGFRKFSINYGVLGIIGIELTKPKKLMDILTEDEIAQRIRSQGIDLSSRITAKMLRALIGKSSDEGIPGGLKKRVRHVMERMRRGDD